MTDQLDKIAAAQEEIELALGDKKLKVRGSDFLGTLTLVICVCGFTIGWYVWDAHAKDANKSESRLVDVLEKIADHQKAQVQATRVTNCMLSIDQKDRQRQLETCERLAR